MAPLRSIRFDRDALAAPDRETTLPWYRDPTGAFESGFWADPAPRTAPIAYEEDELCVLLAGKVRITDEDGETQTYEAGDAFVIPCGFRGTWETVEPVRKFYATHKPAD
jgi:uncharacterized cupin superfamily protein